ncbi:unnamed protein product [Penicillium salamii]|nr:unnamed protein product [Penicillium salamii]
MASTALSLSSSTRDLDPTQQLREALTRFESILTEDQKRKYQASNMKPDAGSVIIFLEEIDNTNNTTKQCMGPRLSTFLGRVQEFANIVDTFVSSHPEIAALVWGGVKTALLVVSNITSYFDKVTSLIMEVGKSCPTYQQFGQLYPGCVKLQSALCGYYAVIVCLCTKIIEVSRRPLLQQTWSAIIKPFEADFKDFIDELAKAVREIEQQISLASKQDAKDAKKLLELESRKNALARKSAAIFQRESKKAHDEERELRMKKSLKEAERLRISIRNNLSTIDHVKYCNRARRQRVKGTAEWLLLEPTFHKWRNDKETAILWCPGTMGAGKTVLMSHVVTYLHKQNTRNEVIAYYFCRVDDAESLLARNIIGSLARQMLDFQITYAQDENLQRLSDASNDLHTSELTDFILTHLHIDEKYHLVIDGLDECEISEIRKVAQSVAQLCRARPEDIKVLYSGRPELERSLFGALRPKFRISVTEAKIGSEMDRYIDATLERCLEEEQLILGDETTRLKIQEALQTGSKGMFLWTRLFIEELCAQSTDNDILEALKHPPRALSDIFDRKLSRVRGKTARDDAFRVLQYCGVLKRPLTMVEYQEALSLSPGQQSLDRGKFPNDMNKIIRHCCGLTCVDEEDNTVHYVHQSVRQHLFAVNSQHSEDFNIASLDRHLGVICMTYLDFTDLKRQLTLFEHASNVPIQPVHFGISPFSRSKGLTGQITQQLILHRHQLKHLKAREFERKAKEVIGDDESSRSDTELRRQDFHFLEYARKHWIKHLPDLQADSHDATWSLFCRCLEGDDIVAHKPWDATEKELDDERNVPLAVQWLSACGNYSLLSYYMRHQPRLLTKEAGHHIFQASAMYCHEHLLKYVFEHRLNASEFMKFWLRLLDNLLQSASNVDDQLHEWGNLEVFLRIGLMEAVKCGYVEVVQQLVAGKTYPNLCCSILDRQTALQQAAEAGHIEIVELLVSAKAGIDTVSGFYDARMAVQAAAAGGHLEIVERLLAEKLNIHTVHGLYDGRTALQLAAAGGHLSIVELLLKSQADVDIISGFYKGRTALRGAAKGGHLEVVEQILAAKDDIERISEIHEIYTVHAGLRTRVVGGGLTIVEGFLAERPDADTISGLREGCTALRAAAKGGHLNIVKRLLAAKANVNIGSSPLKAAAAGGHLEIVKRLLVAKAHVDGNYSRETSPLEAAEKGGHLEVVDVLIKAGAKIPLKVAAARGHLETVKRLLAEKAHVDGNYSRETSPVEAAMEGGHLEVVKVLMEAGAKPPRAELHE